MDNFFEDVKKIYDNQKNKSLTLFIFWSDGIIGKIFINGNLIATLMMQISTGTICYLIL